MRVDERLLKYVSYWTTSSEDSDTIPSTDRQFNLAKELEKSAETKGWLSEAEADKAIGDII